MKMKRIKKLTGNTEWHCYDGRTIKLKDLEDRHLLNIILHLNEYPNAFSNNIIKFMEKMADKRGLTKVEKKIPYKLKGKWQLWTPNGIKNYVGERKLDIDICKSCRMSEFNGYWVKNDEEMYKKGIVVCYKESNIKTAMTKIPENCAYGLEQLVSNQRLK